MDHADGLMRIARQPDLRAELEPALGHFCHQARNRLNSLKLAIHLAKRQSADGLESTWRCLEGEYLAIEDRLDRVQRVCRGGEVARVAIDLGLLFDDRARPWGEAMRRSGASLILMPPPGGCRTRIDVDRVGLGLDDLVHWRAAARAGRREVHVAWERQGGASEVRWSEAPLDSTTADPAAAEPWRTWALPALARAMADHGGTLSLVEGPTWVLTLRWPD